jgi:hypothetical protein
VSDAVHTLYRPVGLKEALLILEADRRAFPPRRPEQPIFYPVLNFEYAKQIARDWNTKSPESGFAGFVTQFRIDETYIKQFEEHVVGASTHRELWIPAESLDEFNHHIQGRIEIIAAYYGEGYKGPRHWHEDCYVDEMFASLYVTSVSNGQDFSDEITLNRNAILLNFKYWTTHDFSQHVLRDGEQIRFLRLLAKIWNAKFPDVHLVGSELVE